MSEFKAQDEKEEYEWQTEYRSALMETDMGIFRDKVQRAALGVFLRLQELNPPVGDAERQALKDAAGALRVLVNTIQTAA
jgi:hypothetical protein